MKYYNFKGLQQRLEEAGLHHSRKWLYKQVNLSFFKPARNPASGRWQFTEEQIEDIIQAFGPLGSGHWAP